jgi:nitroreductase
MLLIEQISHNQEIIEMDLIKEKSVSEVSQYRRSVRVFKTKLTMKESERMYSVYTRSSKSSNMQLWEFYQITTPKF